MQIQGSIVALVTPMRGDGSLCLDSLAGLVDWHLQQGTSGIVAVGTTGESATLDVAEHLQVVSAIIARVAGRVPVIAGTGANSTTEALHLTRAAADAGADACMLVTPYYNKPTQEGLYRHYRTIAEEVDIPQLLYNVPGRTSCDLLPATVARLAELDNIVGFKEAVADTERMDELVELVGPPAADGFALISGDDPSAVELLARGGTGMISVTANVAPRQMSEICAAAQAGNFAAARALNRDMAELHRVLFVESNPIPTKWALYRMGRIPEGIRLPLTPLDEVLRSDLEAVLSRMGFFDENSD